MNFFRNDIQILQKKNGSFSGRFSFGFMEAGILMALVCIPLYFDSFSGHVFENHKMALLRAFACIVIGAQLAALANQHSLAFIRNSSFRLLAFSFGLYFLSQTLSLLFSINPVASFWGEIFRQSGFLTELALGSLFLATLFVLPRPGARDRIIFTLIFTSVPVCLYSIIQHFGYDPMPWQKPTSFRSISTLGNAVFLGAYLAMVFFPTMARFCTFVNSARENEKSIVGPVTYGLIALLQIIALYCTQSRGPWLAVLAQTAFFTFMAFRSRLINKSLLSYLGLLAGIFAGAVALGSTLILLVTNSQSLLDLPDSLLSYWLWPLAFLFCSLFLLRQKKNTYRLFFSLVILGLFLFVSCMILAIPRPFFLDSSSSHTLQKQTAIEARNLAGAGSIKKRLLMWEGYWNTYTSKTPLKVVDPSGKALPQNDAAFGLRRFLGYGQETTGAIFRQRYPEKLLQKLPIAQTADRAHNDIFQRLVSGGILSLIAYFWLIWIIIHRGFIALGFGSNSKRSFFTLGSFLFVFAGIGALTGLLGFGPALLGVGMQVGFLAGVYAYALFSPRNNQPVPTQNAWICIGVMCALLAHITEITVSFPFSLTGLLFWVLAAVLFHTPDNAEENTQNFPASQSIPKLIVIGLAGSMILFCFLANQWPSLEFGPDKTHLFMQQAKTGLGNALSPVFWFLNKKVDKTAGVTTLLFGLLFLPLLLGLVLEYISFQPQKSRDSAPAKVGKALGVSGLVLVTALCFLLVHQLILQKSAIPVTDTPVIEVGKNILYQTKLQANRVIYLFVFLGVWLSVLAWSLKPANPPSRRLQPASVFFTLFCLLASAGIISSYVIPSMTADIYASRASQWKTGNAARFLGTRSHTPRLSLFAALVLAKEATANYPALNSNWTDIGEAASLLAAKTSPGKSYFGQNAPDAKSILALTPSQMEQMTRVDFQLIAFGALKHIADSDPSDPQNALNVGRHLRYMIETNSIQKDKEDKFSQLLFWYNTALAMMPPNARINQEVGSFLASRPSNVDQALLYLKKSNQIDDSRPKTYCLLADAQLAKWKENCGSLLSFDNLNDQSPAYRKQLDEIIDLLTQAHKINPNDTRVIVRLVGTLMSSEKTRKALELISLGLKIEPRSKPLLAQLIMAEQKIHVPDMGRAILHELIQNAPDSPWPKLTMARYLAARNLMEDALTNTRHAAEARPNDHVVWYEIASLYQTWGYTKNARWAIEKALKLDASRKPAWLLAAIIYEQNQALPQAASALERAASLTRNNREMAKYYRRIAGLYSKIGEIEAADLSLQRAITLEQADKNRTIGLHQIAK